MLNAIMSIPGRNAGDKRISYKELSARLRADNATDEDRRELRDLVITSVTRNAVKSVGKIAVNAAAGALYGGLALYLSGGGIVHTAITCGAIAGGIGAAMGAVCGGGLGAMMSTRRGPSAAIGAATGSLYLGGRSAVKGALVGAAVAATTIGLHTSGLGAGIALWPGVLAGSLIFAAGT